MVAYHEKDIAIIGIAGRFPEAENLDLFWQNLAEGRDSVRPFPPGRVAELREIAGSVPADVFVQGGYLETISYFDPEYFAISSEEARYIDPQQRLLMELVDEAVDDAGYGGRLWGKKVGVYMAGGRNQYTTMIDPSMPMAIANIPDSSLPGRIAYVFNLTGPVMYIDTACSSSLTAIHCACQAIRAGECDYAVAGGVKINVIPMGKGILQTLPILSKTERARAFDKDADGTTFGEGGAVILLKRLRQAVADGDSVHAVIKASAVNSDGGRSNGLAAPNQDAQAEVIHDVLTRADVEATSISYIETHGTGTRLGDPIEVEGIARAFAKHTVRKQFIAISSLKSNIGHLDNAAGAAGLTKVVLALRHKALPPSIHYHAPNPHIDFVNSPVYVNDTLREWRADGARRAGVTSLGLTGTNVHMLLEEAPRAVVPPHEEHTEIITLSAQNRASLETAVRNLRRYLTDGNCPSISDVAYTLNTGRKHLSHRVAMVARDKAELLRQLHMLEEHGLDMVHDGVDVAPKGMDAASKGMDAVSKGMDAASKGMDAASKGMDEASKSVDAVPKGMDAAQKRMVVAQKGLDAVQTGPDASRQHPAVSDTGREKESVYYGEDNPYASNLSPVFIFGDYFAEDREIGDGFLQDSSSFAEAYQMCMAEGGREARTRLFALQYASAKLLISLGIEPNAVLGIGLGKSVSDLIQGKTSLQAALARSEESQPATGLIDTGRLWNVLQQMRKDGHNLFIVLESVTRLGRQVKELLAEQQGVTIITLDQEKESFYCSLCELYVRGTAIQWDGLYQGAGYRRVHLPTYAYNRRSFLIQREALKAYRRMAAASEPLLSGQDDDPLNEIETRPVTADDLLQLFRSITGMNFDPELDFTANGANSIMVMQAAGLIKRKYQVAIPMDLFYTATSIHELANMLVERVNTQYAIPIETGNVATGNTDTGHTDTGKTNTGNLEAGKNGETADGAAEDASSTESDAIPVREQAEQPERHNRHLPILSTEEIEALRLTVEAPERILLTGATGFLGAHLIYELIRQTDAVIYCLTRGDNPHQAGERVRERLHYYFGGELEPHFGKRIAVIRGELTEPALGLEPAQYDELAERTDTVIHTAADVRHQGKYAVFERNNVFTTRQMLEFALHRRQKVFHHASTFAVSGWNAEYRMFGEDDFDTGQTFRHNPYGQSKFEAEKLVYAARSQGLRASVYRVGNLSGRYTDGHFQPNIESNEVYGYIKSILLLGQIPSGIRNGRYEITPVDATGDAMVRLMRYRELTGYTYHLPSPRLVTFGELLDGLHHVGYRIAEVDFAKFYQSLSKAIDKEGDSMELNLLWNNVQAANDRSAPQQDAAVRPLRVQTEFTCALLAKAGFHWPELDQAYLERIFAHCAAVGYFPEPEEKSVMGRISRLFKR